MTDLTVLSRAYRDAVNDEVKSRNRLRSAQASHREAVARVEQQRKPLADAIAEAARGGMTPPDIRAAIEYAYTRQRIYQICLAAGVEPVE